MAGMTIAALSAAVASFSGLYGLATIAGWPRRLAWLLPLTIDAYAMTSARVWLADSTHSTPARRFARANALGAIASSIAGNATYHAIVTGLLEVTWPTVVIVGAVPAAVLGLTAHLHALSTRIDQEDRPTSRPEYERQETEDETEPRTDSQRTKRSRKRPRSRTEDELLAAARDANVRYRETHGRTITRDALRAELRIGGNQATELRRLLIEATPQEGVSNSSELTSDEVHPEEREEVMQP